jgi:hypothetical protein
MKISSLFIFVAAVALNGCSGIRVVKLTEVGGEIALFGDRVDAMEKAVRTMTAHCGPEGYKVVEQGEAVVGQVATTQERGGEDTVRLNRQASVTTTSKTTTSTVQDKTEWRVTFACLDESGAKKTALYQLRYAL